MILVVLLVTSLTAEVVLRIYNPFCPIVRTDDIALPVYQTIVRTVPADPRISGEWHRRHNSIGFRGPEPPEDFAHHKTIVTVGGSTTACYCLSDGFTWTDELRRILAGSGDDLWINNAGFIGHSTFGHLVLLRDYLVRLRPTYVLFLIGLNDVGRRDRTAWDGHLVYGSGSLKNRVIAASELLSTLRTLRHFYRSVDEDAADVQLLDFATLSEHTLPSRGFDELRSEYASLLEAYRSRVSGIVDTCRTNDIIPILITQPAMYGEGTDPATGIDIGSRASEDGTSAAEKWRILEFYNDVTRSVAAERKVHLIDLARKLRKDSTHYFDWVHFSLEGAREVARIIAEGFLPILAR